jgi:putative RecB family exonuclease
VTYPLEPERDLHLQGYIDRLVDLGGGHFEIHDYKTSRRLPTQADVDRDRQLALYQLGVMQQFTGVRSVRLVWHYLAHDRMLTSSRTPEQLRQLRDEVVALIGRIEEATARRDFPAHKSVMCDWCEYRAVCPAWSAATPAPTGEAAGAAPVESSAAVAAAVTRAAPEGPEAASSPADPEGGSA